MHVQQYVSSNPIDMNMWGQGAVLAQNPKAYKDVPGITPEEALVVEREFTHKWSHPKELYHLVIMCSLAAVVQGMGMCNQYFSWNRISC